LWRTASTATGKARATATRAAQTPRAIEVKLAGSRYRVFAAAIERMLGNYEHFESRRSEMVAYARLRFSVDAMVFEHERLYAELSLASAQPRRLRVKPAGRSSINVLLKAYEIRSKVRTVFGARLHEPFRSSRIS